MSQHKPNPRLLLNYLEHELNVFSANDWAEYASKHEAICEVAQSNALDRYMCEVSVAYCDREEFTYATYALVGFMAPMPTANYQELLNIKLAYARLDAFEDDEDEITVEGELAWHEYELEQPELY